MVESTKPAAFLSHAGAAVRHRSGLERVYLHPNGKGLVESMLWQIYFDGFGVRGRGDLITANGQTNEQITDQMNAVLTLMSRLICSRLTLTPKPTIYIT